MDDASTAAGARKRVGARRGRRATVPLNPDPIGLAAEIEQESEAGGGVARALLQKQTEFIEVQQRLALWQIRGERLVVGLKLFTALAGTVAALIVAGLVLAAARSHDVIVQAFDAPQKFVDQGLSGKVVAGGVQDGLARIQEATRLAAARRHIVNAWTGEINVEVPETGVSLGEIDRMLREKLGHNTYVTGSLVDLGGGQAALTVRAEAVPARTFTGPADKIADLTTKAAEYVYGQSEPRLFAAYLNQQNRYQDSIDFISAIFPRTDVKTQAALANSWANALSSLNRDAEAVAKYRLSTELAPQNWQAWGNLVGELMRTEGEEAAARAGAAMVREIARSHTGPRPEPDDTANYQLQVQDWTGWIDGIVAQAARARGGSNSNVTADTGIAYGHGRRREWALAARYLATADRSDRLVEPTGWLIDGQRALDEGRPADAIAPLEKFDAANRSDVDLAYTYMDGPCWLGLAYGLAGNQAKADAVFKRAGRWTACLAFQADIIEARGDHVSADAAYAQAVALAPSLPFAYQRWGEALLRRGDLAGARSRFLAAAARGPRWADPLKGMGDVAARQGRWAEAEAAYAKASVLAPGWQGLNRAWSVALSHLGRRADAAARLQAAG